MKSLLTLLFLFSLSDFFACAISAGLLWQTEDKWCKKTAIIMAGLALESLTVLVTYIISPPSVTLSETSFGLTRLLVRTLRTLIVWRFTLKLIGIKPFIKPERPPTHQAEQTLDAETKTH